MVSAIKIGGRRLHELARAGVEVDRPPRTVTVTRFELGAPVDPDPGSTRRRTGFLVAGRLLIGDVYPFPRC